MSKLDSSVTTPLLASFQDDSLMQETVDHLSSKINFLSEKIDTLRKTKQLLQKLSGQDNLALASADSPALEISPQPEVPGTPLKAGYHKNISSLVRECLEHRHSMSARDILLSISSRGIDIKPKQIRNSLNVLSQTGKVEFIPIKNCKSGVWRLIK